MVTANLSNTTTSLQTVCPLDSSLSIENVSLALSPVNTSSQERIRKYKLGETPPLCKCICQYNVTLSEIQEAIRELKKENALKMKAKGKNN